MNESNRSTLRTWLRRGVVTTIAIGAAVVVVGLAAGAFVSAAFGRGQRGMIPFHLELLEANVHELDVEEMRSVAEYVASGRHELASR
ncbi:MAG: hypothetical protein RIT81_03795 [Deltaproteobacteria bacterium]